MGVVVIIMASGNVFKGRVRAIIHGKPVLTSVGVVVIIMASGNVFKGRVRAIIHGKPVF